MSLTKTQRDLVLTTGIGGGVLLAVGLVIVLFMMRGSKPAQSTAASKEPAETVSAEATEAAEPVPEVLAPAEKLPEATAATPAVDPLAELLERIRPTLRRLYVPDEEHTAVAGLVDANSIDAWQKATAQQQAFYCLWMADKLHDREPFDTKAGIAVVYQQFLLEAAATAGSSSISSLVATYNVVNKNLLADAAKATALLNRKGADIAARQAGRVLKVEVLSKHADGGRAQIKVRVTNESAAPITAILQAEMTLLGKHAGHGPLVVSDLQPNAGVIETIYSQEDDLHEGFDDFTLAITQQPRDGHYALELKK